MTEREEEVVRVVGGLWCGFYRQGAGAPREVCTASMAEHRRGHWMEWRCRRADVVLHELLGATACVREAAGAWEKAEKA